MAVPGSSRNSARGGNALPGRLPIWGMAAILLLASASGCAPTQIVPIQVEPQPVTVYLDGEPVEGPTESLKLKANRDHTLFFRRDGYRPELVVLQTREIEGKHQLVPERVELELEQIRENRPGLELEFEDEG